MNENYDLCASQFVEMLEILLSLSQTAVMETQLSNQERVRSLIRCSPISLKEDFFFRSLKNSIFRHPATPQIVRRPPGSRFYRSPPSTCPSIAVLLAHIGSVLQQDPGAVQVAQSDGQVERSPTTRVQGLQVALDERVNRAKTRADRGCEC